MAVDPTDDPQSGQYQQPPWWPAQAPGSEPPIFAPPIVPVYRWAPVLALLDDDQIKVINSEQAARQAQVYQNDPRRQ